MYLLKLLIFTSTSITQNKKFILGASRQTQDMIIYTQIHTNTYSVYTFRIDKGTNKVNSCEIDQNDSIIIWFWEF